MKVPEITVSDAAFAFLKSFAIPLEDTTTTVVDRLIAEYQKLGKKASATNGKGLHFDLHSVPSVKFTTINSAKVDGKPAGQKYWNNILEDMIVACSKKGVAIKDIMDAMIANCQPGIHAENGFRYVKAANFSFQGLEANRAYKNIVELAEKFEIPVEISVIWQDKEDAALPNKTALIVYP